MDLKRLTEVFPLVIFQSVLYFLHTHTNKSDVVTLEHSRNNSGPTDKTRYFVTSDVKSTKRSEVKTIATSDGKSTATNDVKNIATNIVKNIVTNDVKNIATNVNSTVTSDVKHIATSDVDNIATSEVKNTAISEVKNIATSDVDNIDTSNVEKLRNRLQPQPMIKMLNQSALYTIKKGDTDYMVPLKIHFIWVGPLFPNEYVTNVKSYRVKNPKYEIYLWTDRNDRYLQVRIKKIKIGRMHSLPLINKRLISMEPNPAAKADMLRYEIIYYHGGIHVDIDSRAEKGFDENFSHSCMTCNKENRYVIWYKCVSIFILCLMSLPVQYHNIWPL